MLRPLKFTVLILLLGLYSCNTSSKKADTKFQDEALLNALLSGEKDLGSSEFNEAKIRQLNYQKANNLDRTNGVVLSKDFLSSGVNGFTEAGINLPSDTSNYSRWDFLVVYPGMAIEGEETRLEPAVFYYKGGLDQNGNFVPVGNPVTVPVLTGGGGDGKSNRSTPPPQ
ncbi:hypothetical protein LAG90_09705 [Marinilongibacter aquaticus]|uniref:hypothetical protein n=1 Tax=Marinilongibacter aquaticus TaxID=2975157 RepID=UPI0021BCFEA1|nr:hypothetical protein [Marinilongibacter aquaticus]UBM60907.1 hypothetical protein LAG90_09705 [Marinilongibacter aquaticus]